MATRMPIDSRRPRLLKLSGEVLGERDAIFCFPAIDRVCTEIAQALASTDATASAPLAIVVGGGNILRGVELKGRSADPTRGDYMGMLATMINGLALKDGLDRCGVRSQVVAPHGLPNIAHAYERDQVMAWLANGTVVIFSGGTSHPFFTTDTTAALRAAEIGAGELLKASKVDGIYTADPERHPDATRLARLTFDEALAGRYGVMDTAAFALCREQRIAIRVFDMTCPGTIAAALGPHPPGSLVSG
jgi:uridylate kinase